MRTCSISVFPAAVVTFVMASVFVSADQARRQSPGGAAVPVEIAMKVGNGAYDAKAQGSCTHAPKAAIYGVLSEMWTVRHEGEGRSLQLTLWKPQDGSAPMFSLAVNGNPKATVTTVRGGEVSGSGSVTLAPAAKGGTFTVAAKEKSGGSISGTIKCDAFTPAISEGGN